MSRVYLETSTPDGRRLFDQSYAYRQYEDVSRWNRTLSSVGTFAYRTMAVGEGDETRGRTVGIISANYFTFFDARPVVGRFFDATEDRPSGVEPVAVLRYGFWQSEFGGRRDVLGASIRVGTVVARVIGVAPPGFEGVSDQRAPAVFVPVTTFAASRDKNFDKDYGWSWLELLVRRRSGVSARAAGADLTNVFIRSWNAQREIEPGLPPASVGRPIAVRRTDPARARTAGRR